MLALVNAAKEKFGMAIVSLLVPVAGVPSAVRLGKPKSVWAKLFYKGKQKRRSTQRFKGSRGDPFWRRGGELRELPGRLGLGSGGSSRRGSTRPRRS